MSMAMCRLTSVIFLLSRPRATFGGGVRSTDGWESMTAAGRSRFRPPAVLGRLGVSQIAHQLRPRAFDLTRLSPRCWRCGPGSLFTHWPAPKASIAH
jgi:hypothetical protein